MNAKSLYDVILNEDENWVNSIFNSTNVPWLETQLTITINSDRKAVIKARIQNINNLAT